MLTLYDFAPSPHCVRVRLALAFAGLRYRKVEMRLDGDQKRASFLALSPFGTVPLLLDGAVPIAQSYAALLWIGDKRPALLPKARAARARTLTWLAAAATELDPPTRRAYDEAYFTRRPDPKVVASSLRELAGGLDRLERARAASPRQAYAAGAKPTVADAALFPSFWLLQDLASDHARALPWKRWPLWSAWYARMAAREDVSQVVKEAEA